MIVVRNNMFETNSSSANTFIIPNDASIKFPKEIKMSTLMGDSSLSENPSIEAKLAFAYDMSFINGTTHEFLYYLRSKGINVINDFDKRSYDNSMLGTTIPESVLDKLLFSDDVTYVGGRKSSDDDDNTYVTFT